MLSVQSPSSLLPAPPADNPGPDTIREAAEGFEALLLSTMLRGARAGLPGDGLTGSHAMTQCIGMLDSALAATVAERAGLGIAEAVARQFSKPEVHP